MADQRAWLRVRPLVLFLAAFVLALLAVFVEISAGVRGYTPLFTLGAFMFVPLVVEGRLRSDQWRRFCHEAGLGAPRRSREDLGYRFEHRSPLQWEFFHHSGEAPASGQVEGRHVAAFRAYQSDGGSMRGGLFLGCELPDTDPVFNLRVGPVGLRSRLARAVGVEGVVEMPPALAATWWAHGNEPERAAELLAAAASTDLLDGRERLALWVIRGWAIVQSWDPILDPTLARLAAEWADFVEARLPTRPAAAPPRPA